MIYICVKLHENISNGFHVTECAQVYDGSHYLKFSNNRNSKSK